MRLFRPLLALLTLLAVFSPQAVRAGATAWIPLEMHGGAIYFDAEVRGRPVKALFSTSSNQHQISKRLVEELGLSLSGDRYESRGRGGIEYDVRSVGKLPVKLFGVAFDLVNVPAHDQDVELVVGAGFLQSFIVQIDYPGSRMRLLTLDAIDMKKVGNVRLGREWEFGTPALEVTFVGGKKRWMALDTSHTGPMLVRRLIAEEEGWMEKYLKQAGSEADQLVLPSVTIGPFELEEVPVQVPAPGVQQNVGGTRPSGPRGDTRVARAIRVSGVIGYELLRHFVVTIDYDREMAHIGLPPEEPAKPAPETANATSTQGAAPGETN